MTAVRLIPGDCLEVIPQLVAEGVVVDAVVTDPPYGLEFMGKEWDRLDSIKFDSGFGHWLAGFADGEGCFTTRKSGDGYVCEFVIHLRADDIGILHRCREITGIGDIDPPRPRSGGGSPLAKWIVRRKGDCAKLVQIFEAFPLRAKKSRDFEIWASAVREWIKHEPGMSWSDLSTHAEILSLVKRYEGRFNSKEFFHYRWAKRCFDVMRPGGFLLAFGGSRGHHRIWCAIEDAGFVIQDTIMWVYGSGFPKGHTQLKPAFEPICVAYKPGGKRELQIDECRIEVNGEHITAGHADSIRRGNFNEHEGWDRPWKRDVEEHASRREAALDRANNLGRWPANLLHDGSDEVMAAFAAFGEKSSGSRKAGEYQPLGMYANAIGPRPEGMERAMPALAGDTGSAARFFYCAKADNDDRWGSRHPTVKPVALMQWLVALVTPPGGTVLDAFAGSGTTGVAALAAGRNAILIEREAEYQADIRDRLAHYEGAGRHSLVVKNRNGRQVDDLPLFADSDLPADWQERDSAGSWRVAIDEMRERLKDAAE